jgi:hypothetical protein
MSIYGLPLEDTLAHQLNTRSSDTRGNCSLGYKLVVTDEAPIVANDEDIYWPVMIRNGDLFGRR